jgi:hypothetical protein
MGTETSVETERKDDRANSMLASQRPGLDGKVIWTNGASSKMSFVKRTRKTNFNDDD